MFFSKYCMHSIWHNFSYDTSKLPMKKISVIFLLLFISAISSYAQRYNQAAGLRLGAFSGLSYKVSIGADNFAEGLLSFQQGGIILTGLYGFQQPIGGTDQLDWYFGGGAHIGTWSNNGYHYGGKGGGSVVGVDFLLGLEFIFPDVPLCLALDWKPAINIVGDDPSWLFGVALTARYQF